MKVNDWFLNGCNYNEGVQIYAGLKNSSHNLLRLFRQKETAYNTAKLFNELSKYKDVSIKETFIKEIASQPNQELTEDRKLNIFIDGSEKVKQPVTLHSYKPLLINMLPVELHPVFIEQKSNFATVCSLKLQMNNLAPESEEKALILCLEIEELFDKIESAWKILDHYIETKEVLKIANTSFSELTPAQLLQRRNYKRAALSKEKTKLKHLEATLLEATTIALKTKLNVQIARTKEKKINLQVDIQKLTELVNT